MKVDEKNELIQEMAAKINKEIDGDMATPESKREIYTNFLDWLQKGGMQQAGIKLRYFSEQNRGIVAACDMPKDQAIFALPLKMAISSTDTYDLPLNKVIAEKYHE